MGLVSWCHCQSPGQRIHSEIHPIGSSRTPYQRKLDESSGAKISRTDFDHNMATNSPGYAIQNPKKYPGPESRRHARSRIHTLNKTSRSWWAVRNCYMDRIGSDRIGIRPPSVRSPSWRCLHRLHNHVITLSRPGCNSQSL